ncbi:hypothetical protein ACROYT_G043365 [Oculina patagonica]
MFPTAGYFRSTNCPFFVHGLCHRPYCHFRHSKPGLKASKSKISPHKHKTELEQHTVNKTKTSSTEGSVEDNLPAAVKITKPDDKTKKSQSVQDTGHINEDEYSTSTTAVKGILKRTNEELSVNDQKCNVEESTPVDSLDQRKAITGLDVTTESNVEMFGEDDTEQPFASLTDEEKKIIGLSAFPPSGSSQSVLATIKCTDLSSASDLSTISSTHGHTSASTKSSENKAGYKGVISSNHGDVKTTDVHKVVKLEQLEMDGSNERLDGSNESIVKAVNERDEMPVNSGLDGISEKHDFTVTKEKSGKSDKSRKRKSVQLQISSERCQDKTPLKDVIAAKKRKSQQLPCVASYTNASSAGKSEEGSKAIKGNESSINQERTLKQFFMSTSKSPKDTERSRKAMSNAVSPDVKKHKAVFDSPAKLKEKSPIKNITKESVYHIPKKKVVSETEISFFGPSKKVQKTDKAEKPKKNREKTTPVKILKPKIDRRGLEKSRLQKTEPKTTTPITILSSDDSDMCSPDNWDSSTDEQNSLKRIWDDFELPQNDNVLEEEDFQSPVKKQAVQDLSRKRLPSTSKESSTEKQPSLVNALGLGKKQRVAHSSGHLPRRLSSNANPVRRYPKTLSAVQKKDESAAPTESSESPVKTEVSYKPAKQRVAHVLKNKTPAGSLPRPRIPVEYGAKVPQSQRQRYLDRIVDEYLRICSTQKEAFEKAVEEEKALYERSTRRQVYLNLCVNAIKKLRDTIQLELPSPVKTETATCVAVTKTLSSGAVLISTKSPVKQDKPALPATDQLTEEVMYDFLSKYLMSEDDLVENGYPRPCPTSPGKAVIKTRKEQPSKDSLRRICCRCGKPFRVLGDGNYLTREECVYHAGKLFRKRGEPITNYSCCQGDAGSPGCCVGKVHVSDNVYNTDGFMTTIVSPLTDQRKKIFSMDCEMCYTTAGLELTRITVVNWNLEQVYDSFVVPERPIMDYNTRFSGVTEESLRGVTTNIHEVQAVLLSMIHRDTILVGHSLESDLKATKLIHSKVVDTSVVFPHRLGPPYKRALRNLMAEHLKKIIQDSVDGHDSHEDAAACLELMRWRVKEDMKKTARHRSPCLSLS